jgi:hypothetical protein
MRGRAAGLVAKTMRSEATEACSGTDLEADRVPRISRLKLRGTIAELLYPISAVELADLCEELGLR